MFFLGIRICLDIKFEPYYFTKKNSESSMIPMNPAVTDQVQLNTNTIMPNPTTVLDQIRPYMTGSDRE
jgi:hypothetical protein